MTYHSTGKRRALLRSTALATAALAIAAPSFAGDHWLSRVHVYDTSGKATTVSHLGRGALGNQSRQSSTAVFDIVISLEENPMGDDDSKVDAGASDDAQNAFENRIMEFANAVFQMTNGAHKIGRVTIYRDYKQRSLADVQWEKDCASNNGPWAHPGGFQKSGKFIHFCTNWPGASTLMPDPKGSGYTLAHEWGHYAYNIYDEYAAAQCLINAATMMGALCPAWQPRATDTVSDTIMHNQWFAASGGVRTGYTGNTCDYLEVSTPDHQPFKTPLASGATGRNGQERFFGESGWETLVRDPATDPTWPGLDRTQYTNLTAPTATNWRDCGSIANAKSELDIRWVGDQVVELMLDRSGSMSGSPIINAKTGANLLIGQLPDGQSAVGVGSFNNLVTQNFAIQDIPDPDAGIKAGAQAAVNALSASGLTALYDGLIEALNQVNTFQTTTGTSREGVVYVLSDGGDNSSSATEASVIAAYQAAGVPIVAFGYGSGAPTGTLVNMANATGGLFLQSPTTAAEITAALLSANAQFSNNVLIGSSSAGATASSTTTQTVTVDSSLDEVSITANYTGAPADLTLRLLNPAGADTGVAFTCTGSTACTATLDSAALTANGTGDYKIEIVNNTASEIDVSTTVSGVPKSGQGYDIRVAISNGGSITYPKPMLIEATVRSTAPLTGLKVLATVEDPASNTSMVTLVDDGTDGDAIADDGTYTGSFFYNSNGVHSVSVTADNSAGSAQTTAQGVAVAVGVDGTVQVPPPMSVSENFTRTASNTGSVSAAGADDHANDPTVPAGCTAITDNNMAVPGRIDGAGDVDCFFFTPTSTANDLVARATNLSAGMKPTIKVFDAAGTTQLLSVDLSASENSTVGTVATIPAAGLKAAGHVVTVQHSDAAAAKGNYEASIGPKQISDTPATGSADDGGGGDGGGGDGGGGDGGTNGGAIGPWSLMFMSLLALLGLRRRRNG